MVAGSAVAMAVWTLLQLFGSGIALCAFDERDLDRLRGIGLGTTAWSVFAPLVGLFLGGMLASRIAGIHERRVSALHGMLVWAFTGILGLMVLSASIWMMTPDLTAHYTTAVPASDLNHRVLTSASDAGTAFLVASLALALGLIAAVGGAWAAGNAAVRRRRLDTEPGHTTAPYPTPPADED